jgi:cytochrome b561
VATLRNTDLTWGWPSKLLHWIVAVLVIAMIALGVVMVDLTQDLDLQYALFQIHKSTGITILALVLLRLGWRLANPTPASPGRCVAGRSRPPASPTGPSTPSWSRCRSPASSPRPHRR